jgi:hypothetical protein
LCELMYSTITLSSVVRELLTHFNGLI